MADRDLAKEFDVVKKDLKELRVDLRSLVESGGNVTSEAMNAARSKLEQEAELLMSKLQDAASGATESGERMLHGVEDRIEDRPIASVLTTFGVGFALGWLFGRK